MIPAKPPKLPPWAPNACARAGKAFGLLLLAALAAHLARQAAPASPADLSRARAALASVDPRFCAPLWAAKRFPDPGAFLAAKAAAQEAPALRDLLSIERAVQKCKDARRLPK